LVSVPQLVQRFAVFQQFRRREGERRARRSGRASSGFDRLARSTHDLLNVLEAVKQAGAGFRSLKDAWCDTTTPHGVLMLTVLGGLAEFERTLIRARTGEGRERAKVRGVRFGRPLELSPHQRREAIERLARSFGVDRATLYRMKAEAVL
jgi:DNA invertase Pin-like site-specific DNA recombinase